MATFTTGDSENAVLMKLLENQEGTYEYTAGDSRHSILRKLLLNQSLGFDPGFVGASLIGNSSEAQQYFDRLPTPPAGSRELLYGELIDTLVLAGIWPLLDILFVFAAADHVTGLVNLVENDLSPAVWPFNLGDFEADRGIVPLGATQEIDYLLDPAVGSRHFTRDSASMFLWNLDSGATDGGSLLFQKEGNKIAFDSGHILWGVNHATNLDTGAVADVTGLWLGNRFASNSSTLTRNNVSVQTSSGASVALVSDYARAGGGTDGTAELAVVGMGASLSASQQTILYAALFTYLSGVGAI